MHYRYTAFDGKPFAKPDSLFPDTTLVQLILQYGPEALEAMANLQSPEELKYLKSLLDAGLIERDPATGEIRLSPRLLRGIEHMSLLSVFADLRQGQREGHEVQHPGPSAERGDGNRPYQFGDSLSDLNLHATLHNAMHRAGSVTLPVSIDLDDLVMHETEGQADAALCILLDMSGSMMRYGRYFHAKRVALGMQAMVRKKFPQDTVDFVGFHSLAERISSAQLPLVMPKPVTLYEHQVRLRMPLDQAMAQPQTLPLHFTNLQLGLRQARQILARRGAANKQIFIITDGQPTAHVEPGHAPGQEMLYLVYPPGERTTMVTLKEALRCTQQGIRIASFALVEDYQGMDWVSFIDKLTRLTRGVAFYCTSDNLGAMLVDSYLKGKRRRAYVE